MSDIKNALIARIQTSVQLAKSGGDAVPDIKSRKRALEKMFEVLRKYSDAAVSVLHEELGRVKYDSYIFELLPLAGCIKYLKKNLHELAAERKVKGSWFTFPARFSVVQQPYGMVFVNGCWNYPFLLALEPVAGAIAAGNRVVLKLSDRTPRCAALVRKIVEEVFQNDEVICVQDELSAAEIVSLGCDCVFFTGSMAGAVEVAKAAAERFVPVIFELGGKNPCIIDSTANISTAVKRIAWGKFTNSGQTCIAPDYLIVHKSIKKEFLNELTDEIRKVYGENPLADSKCCKIVDSFAYERLNLMSKNGRLIAGGEKEPGERRISPTVVDQLNEDDPLLTEEVFGPLLGVVGFGNEDELLRLLRRNPDPLAIYYFGDDTNIINILKSKTRSGAICINDCLIQFSNKSVPFGGIGSSGVGAYHGSRTFSAFSFSRAVARQSKWFDFNLRYRGGRLKEKLAEYIFKH